MLGPPRLSKLLFEAHLLSVAFGSMSNVMKATAQELSDKCSSLISFGADIRSAIISIGIPILMADGKTLLRGPQVKIPPARGARSFVVTTASINAWAHDGWVDLRTKNMARWLKRFEVIANDVRSIPAGDTSSRSMRTAAYWDNFEKIEPGKLVGWIFSEEEHGKRMKA
jgi:hypothetical protein